MTYRGHFKNGVIVPDTPVDLPEGSAVTIEPLDEAQLFQTLRDGLKRFSGVVEGPEDLAENHDFYAHGKPRQ